MTTLLLQLAAPQQAWGDHSRFNHRDTRREPTKSGVLGLVAAAEGRSRDADLSDLSKLEFGVRIDQPGTVETDFQTEIDWRTGDSKALTYRSYLSDAKFLVALSGKSRAQLESISKSLRNPHFPLFLGRRAFPPTGRIVHSITDESLVDALTNTPWLASEHYRRKQSPVVYLEAIRDTKQGDPVDEIIQDSPVSFHPKDRRHAARTVVRFSVSVSNPDAQTSESLTADNLIHDPFSLLGDR